MYVLAGATPKRFGDPILVDETLTPFNSNSVDAGDVVGIGIHTANALRGYQIGKAAHARGAYVIFGGIHATLYPQEPLDLGGAHGVVQGDGDVEWATVLSDCFCGSPKPIYVGGRIEAEDFVPARWDLIDRKRYMWASVQTIRGCPKHCSFCSVWRTDGQRPRQRQSDAVIAEVVQLRRLGFRFIALADDNFSPVSLRDLQCASESKNTARLAELQAIRNERFQLMSKLALLPSDMIFFTQITMEAAEDPAFLDAMKNANIKGALVGVESVTPEGLKDVYKDFNLAGEKLVERLQTFRRHGIHVLGSFIFGLPSDRPETFAATADIADRAGVTFAQFVLLSPFPGTVDFARWEKQLDAAELVNIAGFPITRRWLIPQELRPRVSWPHSHMSAEEIRQRTQQVWDRFYAWRAVWKRSRFIASRRDRLVFVLISRVYRQMYADTGITTDSARAARSAQWARWLAKPCRLLFAGRSMPDLTVPPSA